MFIEGNKVGYGRTQTKQLLEHGQDLNQVEEEVHFSVTRNGQPSEERIVSTGIETPAGQLLRFRTEIESGSAPIVTTGEVRDGEMCFQTISTGSRHAIFDPMGRLELAASRPRKNRSPINRCSPASTGN